MKKTPVFVCAVVSIFFIYAMVLPLWAVEPSKSGQVRQTKPQAQTPPKPATQQPAVKQPATVLPQISIATPAEGASFYMSETCDITWVAILPGATKLTIELILPGNIKHKLAEPSLSPAKFAWNITKDSFRSEDVKGHLSYHRVYFDTNAKLKLSAVHEGKTYEAEREVKLLVPKIKITSPGEGTVWNVGKTYTVTWQKQGPLASTASIFFGAASSLFIPSFTMQTGNTGTASITLPASAYSQNWTQKYLLKVETELAATQFGVVDSVLIDLKP